MALPNIYALTDTRWNNAGTMYNGIWLDVNNGAGGSAVGANASRPFKLTNNNAPMASVDLNGAIYGSAFNQFASGSEANINLAFGAGASGMLMVSNYAIQWVNQAAGAVSVFSSTVDLVLQRDAANTLALRNGTNVQTFNIYGSFTDTSNYKRLRTTFNGSDFQIFVDGVGTGAGGSSIVFQSNSQAFLSVGPSGGSALGDNLGVWWRWNGTTGHLTCDNDNTRNIGASGANRPANVFIAGYEVVGVFTWGSISASVTPQEGLMIGCSSAATVAAGATVAASGTGHALLYYDGTQYKACN